MAEREPLLDLLDAALRPLQVFNLVRFAAHEHLDDHRDALLHLAQVALHEFPLPQGGFAHVPRQVLLQVHDGVLLGAPAARHLVSHLLLQKAFSCRRREEPMAVVWILESIFRILVGGKLVKIV